jgi:hypothetical protein
MTTGVGRPGGDSAEDSVVFRKPMLKKIDEAMVARVQLLRTFSGRLALNEQNVQFSR